METVNNFLTTIFFFSFKPNINSAQEGVECVLNSFFFNFAIHILFWCLPRNEAYVNYLWNQYLSLYTIASTPCAKDPTLTQKSGQVNIFHAIYGIGFLHSCLCTCHWLSNQWRTDCWNLSACVQNVFPRGRFYEGLKNWSLLKLCI